MDRKHGNLKVSKEFRKYLTDHLHVIPIEIFRGLFGVSVTSLPKCRADISEQEQVERFLTLFKLWKKDTGGTFEKLKCALDSISIFASSDFQSGHYTGNTQVYSCTVYSGRTKSCGTALF